MSYWPLNFKPLCLCPKVKNCAFCTMIQSSGVWCNHCQSSSFPWSARECPLFLNYSHYSLNSPDRTKCNVVLPCPFGFGSEDAKKSAKAAATTTQNDRKPARWEGDRIQTVSTDTNQRTWVPQSKCVTGIRIQRFDTTDTIQISIWILITLHGSGDTIQMVWIMSLITCFGLCSCWQILYLPFTGQLKSIQLTVTPELYQDSRFKWWRNSAAATDTAGEHCDMWHLHG